MRRIITTGLVIAAMGLTALAQDWYHDRDQRYQGEEWRPHIFNYVRTDLEHVWSASQAKDRERVRLDKTKEELYKMQVDLEQGRFDNGILNDVIDSLRKSSTPPTGSSKSYWHMVRIRRFATRRVRRL